MEGCCLFLSDMSFQPIPAVNMRAGTGGRTSKVAGRQAGRGRGMLQEGRLRYVGDCASILTRARKSSPPCGGLSSVLRPSQQLVLQPVTRGAVVTAAIDRVG